MFSSLLEAPCDKNNMDGYLLCGSAHDFAKTVYKWQTIKRYSSFKSNQIKFRNTHKISGNKTILKLEKNSYIDF